MKFVQGRLQDREGESAFEDLFRRGIVGQVFAVTPLGGIVRVRLDAGEDLASAALGGTLQAPPIGKEVAQKGGEVAPNAAFRRIRRPQMFLGDDLQHELLGEILGVVR